MSNAPRTGVGARGGGGHEVRVCFPIEAVCENDDRDDGSDEGEDVCDVGCLSEVESEEDDGPDEAQG